MAIAILRAGEVPGRGGTLCLAGDCGNCLATVDGIAYVRTCQVAGAARVSPSSATRPTGMPALPVVDGTDADAGAARPRDRRRAPAGRGRRHRRRSGGSTGRRGGRGGRARRPAPRRRGWPGGRRHLPRPDGRGPDAGRACCTSMRARSSSPPARPRSSRSARATTWPASSRRAPRERLHAAGLDLGAGRRRRDAAGRGALPGGRRRAGSVRGRRRRAADRRRDRGSGDGTRDDDALSDGDRRAGTCAARPAGPHGRPDRSRASGRGGRRRCIRCRRRRATRTTVVCRCMDVTVANLDEAWSKGFTELELLKRATLAGIGTCQGGACLPHVRAWIAARTGEVPAPFTARPASRQITLAEAAADVTVDAFRRTPLHDEHLAAGARMDRFGGWWRPWHYGDAVAEYWAVRQGGLAGRREHARQARRLRPRRGRGAGAALPLPRRATSSPGARATRCCSTSAATSWTTA